MSFTNVKFHPIHEDSKMNDNVMGFISGAYEVEQGRVGFNSVALMRGPHGPGLSFSKNKILGFDYFYVTGQLKEELLEASLEAFDHWKKEQEAKEVEDGNAE